MPSVGRSPAAFSSNLYRVRTEVSGGGPVDRSRSRQSRRTVSVLLLAALLALSACAPIGRAADPSELAGRPVRVVTTTGLIADAVRQVGGSRVEVTALMGPGVDPHLYKAREGDVLRLARADIVFYHGLHLEAKMADVLSEMGRWVPTYAVGNAVDPADLLYPEGSAGSPDPHIWFDVRLWMRVVASIADALAERDPAHREVYRANAEAYLRDLAELDGWVREQVGRVPPEQRVLVTAHDAFGYFARAYNFEVRGLQGISTVAEAGIADVQELADFIVRRRIRAIFVESSVPVRNIEAVQEAVRARGWEVAIGGQLYSDSLGEPDTEAGTYTGMVRHNVRTIVEALAGQASPHGGSR